MSGQIRAKRTAIITAQDISSTVTSGWHIHHGESQVELEVAYVYSAGTGFTITVETADAADTVFIRNGYEDAGSGVYNLNDTTYTYTGAASKNAVFPFPLVADRFRVKMTATGSPDSSDTGAVAVLTAQV